MHFSSSSFAGIYSAFAKTQHDSNNNNITCSRNYNSENGTPFIKCDHSFDKTSVFNENFDIFERQQGSHFIAFFTKLFASCRHRSTLQISEENCNTENQSSAVINIINTSQAYSVLSSSPPVKSTSSIQPLGDTVSCSGTVVDQRTAYSTAPRVVSTSLYLTTGTTSLAGTAVDDRALYSHS